MRLFDVLLQGIVIGRVQAKNFMEACKLANRYFKDCDGLSNNYNAEIEMVWVGQNFALVNKAW
jgi:hypothetical protein